MPVNTTPCLVNTATSIAEPGTDTDAFGVKRKRYIHVVAATASFVDYPTELNPGDLAVNFGNNPYRVANGAGVVGATIGTVWYYIQ